MCKEIITKIVFFLYFRAIRNRGKELKRWNKTSTKQNQEQQVSTVDNKELDIKDAVLKKAYGSLYESKKKASKAVKSGKGNIDSLTHSLEKVSFSKIQNRN